MEDIFESLKTFILDEDELNTHSTILPFDVPWNKGLPKELQPTYGRKLTPEQCNKLSEIHNGNKYWVGKKHSLESKAKMAEVKRDKKASIATRKKMSDSNKGKNLGKPKSAIHKMKLSEAMLNLPIIKCPYCNICGKGSNMTRYHFNNCKKRK
jgi:hypothetical protein